LTEDQVVRVRNFLRSFGLTRETLAAA